MLKKSISKYSSRRVLKNCTFKNPPFVGLWVLEVIFIKNLRSMAYGWRKSLEKNIKNIFDRSLKIYLKKNPLFDGLWVIEKLF